jgi:hypothetical protein
MTPDAAVQRGPTIELYDSPVSTSGQKVRMTLLEKGLARTDRIILFGRNDHLFHWVPALNSNGGVPTLVRDRNAIGRSSVSTNIVKTSFRSCRCCRASLSNTCVLGANISMKCHACGPIHPPTRFLYPIWSRMTDEQFWPYAEKLLLRRHFCLKMRRSGFPKDGRRLEDEPVAYANPVPG